VSKSLLILSFIFCGCSHTKQSALSIHNENVSVLNSTLEESSQEELGDEDDSINRRFPKIVNKYPNCKLLANGYLVCPKAKH